MFNLQNKQGKQVNTLTWVKSTIVNKSNLVKVQQVN